MVDEDKGENVFDKEYKSLPRKGKWMSNFDEDEFKILDPDDPLMERFQQSLKSHLIRIDTRLNEEIFELEAELKEANKIREDEGLILYDVQQEASRQEGAIENYKDMLAEVIKLRGELDERLALIKEKQSKINEELEAKKTKQKMLVQSMESLESLYQQFSKWESDLTGNLKISKRISEKDALMERELLYQKQQRDYVLYKLEDEVWKLQSEIKDLDEQLQLKDQEKVALGQRIADANADLQGLEKEHKTLYSAWNNVLNLVSQRDKINEEINTEQKKIRESLQHLQAQIEKLKKDSAKEMENNERLTSFQTRVNDEIKLTKKLSETDKEKFLNLELDFLKTSKFVQQYENELHAVTAEFEALMQEEKSVSKEIDKTENQKRALENEIVAKLDDKVSHDKAIRYMNKLLHEAKDANLENELCLSRFENAHAKSLLELGRLNTIIESEKYDLNLIMQTNQEKEKENEAVQAEIKNYDALQKQKDRKIDVITKKLMEIKATTGRDDASPLDLKIASTEGSIETIEEKIKKSQQFWLRLQEYVFSLSEQKDTQIRELNVLTKEILLMEQKNSSLEAELEKQAKEEANMTRTISSLQQKLLQINTRLTSQKELKVELEDKNNFAKIEYVNAYKNAELEILKLESDIEDLKNEKQKLKEDLKFTQQETLSWEKKVQIAQETTKSYKEERNSGGDIATMKSEIHKMEMRLSHLQKAQEKLVQDMEHCISRRDFIIDEAMARKKKNPKSEHNQRIVLRKRLDDQKTKIKQLNKESRQMDTRISNVQAKHKQLLEFLNTGQKVLRQQEDIIPDIDRQIFEGELIKHHNLEVLVRKQRRVNMLSDLKRGQYKPQIKNESVLNEEWQNQRSINNYLNEVMLQTQHDFPLLKNEIRKILLTLETN